MSHQPEVVQKAQAEVVGRSFHRFVEPHTGCLEPHKIRTARNKIPIAIFELSREEAIRRGYWTGDPGDDPNVAADPFYGYDGHAPLPPIAEQNGEPQATADEPVGIDAEREAGICINDDEKLDDVRELMEDFDFGRDDENWGIDVYC
ncbi:hypothetical protein B0H13DRAFT_2333170 [Mycena leptocephala]|nr:hypothetical protein B0H13DRAFT_2333170 [Mycena leptocephala]